MGTAETLAPPPGSGDLLLDRDRELAAVEALLADLRAGQARALVVEGGAGIGKTRLLTELRIRADAAGVSIRRARGSELERDFPFGVVRQLFEPLLRDPDARDRLLAGAAAPAAVALAPLVQTDHPPTDATFAVLHGLYWLTANVAGDDPLLLTIDDLHWCDSASLRYLAYLLKRLDGLPVSLAVTLRPDEPGAAALIGEVVRDPLAVALRPAPLSEQATGEVLRLRLSDQPDAAFAAATHRATGGNPLLLHELVAMMEAEGVRPLAARADVVRDLGPRAVSRTVVSRLSRLPAAATATARALAVLGEGAELPRLAALAGVDEADAAEALQALAQAEIVRREPPVAFAHPLVRDAIYRDLPPGQRELVHTRAAELLRATGAPPEQVAAQLLASPRRGDIAVVDALADAARRAAAQGAPDSAVAYLRRALEEPPAPERRAALLLELGAVEAEVSLPEAVTHLRTALDGLQDPPLRAAAAEGLARMLIFGGDPDGAVAVADRAQGALSEDDDLWRRLEALSLMARPFGAELGDAPQRFERARERPLAPGDGARMLAITAAWDWACSGGSADACSHMVLDALEDGAIVTHDPGFLAVLAAATLLYADRPEVAAVLDAAQAEAHRSGSLFVALAVDMWRGHASLLRGELEDAEAALSSAQERFEAFGIAETNAGAYTKSNIVRVLVEQGRLEEARRVQDRPIAIIAGSDGDAIARRSEIELLLAEDRPADALAAADALRESLRRIVNPAVAPWRTLRALALDRLGRSDEALAVAHDELEIARRFGAPGSVGRALRIVGTLERQAGIPRLEEAVAVLEGSTARLELAKALVAYGAALRRGRRPTEARDPLRRALDLAESCSAPPLLEQARAELHASGARPRRTALGGVASLTPSERRVADLAAAGQSNREIAQALFVTLKTVEIHLSNAYRKLDIRSRHELPAALTA